MNRHPKVSVITPTTGADGLLKLIESLKAQDVAYEHILLWDDKRDGRFDPASAGERAPGDLDDASTYSIVIRGRFVQGKASGSALRAVGLMAAQGDYVTFADSDVWYEPGHLKRLAELMRDHQWAFCRRRIWKSDGVCLGVDNFESVGDSPERRVRYLLVDNNTMMFTRRLGVTAAALYRETTAYNDDRLMTKFLYTHGGTPGQSREASVNQVCPKHLEKMFASYCTP